ADYRKPKRDTNVLTIVLNGGQCRGLGGVTDLEFTRTYSRLLGNLPERSKPSQYKQGMAKIRMKSATIRQRTSSVKNQAVISAMLEPLSATLASMLRTVARAMPHSFAMALMLLPAAFISASR